MQDDNVVAFLPCAAASWCLSQFSESTLMVCENARDKMRSMTSWDVGQWRIEFRYDSLRR